MGEAILANLGKAPEALPAGVGRAPRRPESQHRQWAMAQSRNDAELHRSPVSGPNKNIPNVTDAAERFGVYLNGCGISGDGDMEGDRNAPSQVRAVFKEAALSFNLSKGATLEDLAKELALFGERYGGAPLYVDVRLRS